MCSFRWNCTFHDSAYGVHTRAVPCAQRPLTRATRGFGLYALLPNVSPPPPPLYPAGLPPTTGPEPVPIVGSHCSPPLRSRVPSALHRLGRYTFRSADLWLDCILDCYVCCALTTDYRLPDDYARSAAIVALRQHVARPRLDQFELR